MPETRWKIGPWRILFGGMIRQQGNGLSHWPVPKVPDAPSLKERVAAEWGGNDLAAATFRDRLAVDRILAVMAASLPANHYADVDLVEVHAGGGGANAGRHIGTPRILPKVRIKSPQGAP